MPSKSPLNSGRRIQTRRSEVHGNGVFAMQDIAEGETIVEYKGEVISWKEALRRHPHDPAQPNHTFYFHIDDKHVIDGKVNGNAARWINHACAPNCEADEQEGRIFIKALRDIAAGEELNYDYGLIIDEEYTPELLAEYPCWCGAETCRGTLLSPKGDDDGAKAEPVRKKKKKKVEKVAKAGKGEKADKVEKLEKKAKAAKPKKQDGKAGKSDRKSGKKADKP
ncbi:SET domain-containing protein-lysine N-methyltransferase [Variovorax sp. dw_954]|uniref:SET domain-containing protein n=1 Tax=Variovorax sp. dw_954 TaxID=2720078 RepID=UPI001BD39D25|nr:SET domain-containing protein-lysine N-methyltransferase [Variovorax sp. dw_954]